MAFPLTGGKLSLDFATAVNLGDVAGWESVPRFGHNANVPTSSVDVWNVGGIRVDVTIAAPIIITSTSADDDVGGTGATSYYIEGVDANHTRQFEFVDANGTGNASTVSNYLRGNVHAVATCGALGGNAGVVTASLGGNALFRIDGPPAGIAHGEGVAHNAHYSVPLGYTAYIMQVESWAGKDVGTEIEMFVRNSPTSPWFSPGQINFYRSPITVEVCGAVVLPETSDFKFIARAENSTTEVSMFTRIIMGENGP